MTRVVVGLDGGGTRTRGLCVALDGRVLARFEGRGANPRHDEHATTHVQEVIRGVVKAAGCSLHEVAYVGAGLAGLDDDSDFSWAETLTSIPGLACPRLHVNDAHAAHMGAFAGGSGIVLVSGTGAIVWGRDDAGRIIRDYDFDHYTYSAARFLGYECVHAILSETTAHDDAHLVRAVLAHFGIANLGALRGRSETRHERSTFDENRLHGALAPAVTRAAEQGSALARRICDAAAARMVTGVRLVSSRFEAPVVPVALVGAIAQHAYIKAKVEALLSSSTPGPACCVREAQLPPEAGSALLALQELGVDLEAPLRRLLATLD